MICIMAHRLISRRQNTKKKTTKVMKQVVMVLMVLYDPKLFFLNTNWSITIRTLAKQINTESSTVIVVVTLLNIKVSV